MVDRPFSVKNRDLSFGSRKVGFRVNRRGSRCRMSGRSGRCGVSWRGGECRVGLGLRRVVVVEVLDIGGFLATSLDIKVE